MLSSTICLSSTNYFVRPQSAKHWENGWYPHHKRTKGQYRFQIYRYCKGVCQLTFRKGLLRKDCNNRKRKQS